NSYSCPSISMRPLPTSTGLPPSSVKWTTRVPSASHSSGSWSPQATSCPTLPMTQNSARNLILIKPPNGSERLHDNSCRVTRAAGFPPSLWWDGTVELELLAVGCCEVHCFWYRLNHQDPRTDTIKKIGVGLL